jgi:hypothetical protein
LASKALNDDLFRVSIEMMMMFSKEGFEVQQDSEIDNARASDAVSGG